MSINKNSILYINENNKTPISENGNVLVFDINKMRDGSTVRYGNFIEDISFQGEPLKRDITSIDVELIYHVCGIILKATLILIFILKIYQISLNEKNMLREINKKSLDTNLSKNSSGDNGADAPNHKKNDEETGKKSVLSDICAFGYKHRYIIALVVTTLFAITGIYLYSSSPGLSVIPPIVNEVISLENNNTNLLENIGNVSSDGIINDEVSVDMISDLQEQAKQEMILHDQKLNKLEKKPEIPFTFDSTSSSSTTTSTQSLLDLVEPQTKTRPPRRGNYIERMQRSGARRPQKALDEEALRKQMESFLKKKK